MSWLVWQLAHHQLQLMQTLLAYNIIHQAETDRKQQQQQQQQEQRLDNQLQQWQLKPYHELSELLHQFKLNKTP
jgi:hypothetical protein